MKQQPSPENVDLFKNTFRASMPLTDDYVFPAVFGRDTEESRAALIEILNIILERKQDPIRAILIKNPIEIPDREADKKQSCLFSVNHRQDIAKKPQEAARKIEQVRLFSCLLSVFLLYWVRGVFLVKSALRIKRGGFYHEKINSFFGRQYAASLSLRADALRPYVGDHRTGQ